MELGFKGNDSEGAEARHDAVPPLGVGVGDCGVGGYRWPGSPGWPPLGLISRFWTWTNPGPSAGTKVSANTTSWRVYSYWSWPVQFR